MNSHKSSNSQQQKQFTIVAHLSAGSNEGPALDSVNVVDPFDGDNMAAGPDESESQHSELSRNK